MGWRTLTYSCGHTEDRQLYGKESERERAVAAARLKDCPACKAAKAAEDAAQEGVAQLKGSVKQIAWAADIRRSVLKNLMEMEKMRAEVPQAYSSEYVKRMQDCVTILSQEDRASWWIERRGYSLQSIINDIVRIT